ncbi:MAG: NADH-ubiquinone oxidoreductase-F iron-sulfur binding region domain-containing protein [Dehalobacterium sp.]
MNDIKHNEMKKTILVCCGTGCLASGSREIFQALEKELASETRFQVKMFVKATGCNGWCEKGPLVKVTPDDITYCRVKLSDVEEIVEKTLIRGQIINRLLYRDPQTKAYSRSHHDTNFYKKQMKVALKNIGEVDPGSLDDYLEHEGYLALKKALDMDPGNIIEEIIASGLRGRGGGGFPTGLKWQSCAGTYNASRYIICNGDEGDPGAFMDRSIMEGDPYNVLEGMTICAYAVGANQGYIYVRDEYDLAVANLTRAIDNAKKQGFLGEHILGSDLSFDIHLVRGGGAFVCGEETALMASIEGNVGEPRDKYVFPSEKGLWGQPTVINNVETWVNISYIIRNGPATFASIGTTGSKGTKVFSLVGKVNNTGLVEVPMGTTLREIIFETSGGIPGGRRFKAVQTGGPSGGCIPDSLLDLPVDFDTLTKAGSMMGSGGIIVMDDRTCMVEVARYYVKFLAEESCGKCVPCREGIRRMGEILTGICEGRGEEGDLSLLKHMGRTMQTASLCALGRTAPNPVLSTIKYFSDEYLAHIKGKSCPAGVCTALTEFFINRDKCTGCGLCTKNCPAEAITGEKKEAHVIDATKCIKCGECLTRCRFDAVNFRGVGR